MREGSFVECHDWTLLCIEQHFDNLVWLWLYVRDKYQSIFWAAKTVAQVRLFDMPHLIINYYCADRIVIKVCICALWKY